jgi:threonyl-tRNA synthetase
MLIIGEKEVNENMVSVRRQGKGDEGSIEVQAFIDKLRNEIENKEG